MMSGNLSQAADSMCGVLHGPDHVFRGISTDTRSVQPGELFIALQGPNFDGNEFVARAAESNAAGAVVSREISVDLPTIVVEDTLAALGKLAAFWRQQLPATVVGVTGSNGKTTLKEMLASCLAISAETIATHGNLNNEIGLPLMLSRIGAEHRYAVIEMGANHAGEIAYLASLAAPEVVVITNAAPAHLEGFGSVEGVARAKGEILGGERRPDFAILNADDDYFDYWASQCDGSDIVSFGLSAAADVRASNIKFTDGGSKFKLHTPTGQVSVSLSLHGRHNVLNACAAAAVAGSLGIESKQIKQGLEAVQPIGGRLAPVKSVSGATLYDDTYNANPVSVQAAAEFLAAQTGTSWLVLGDMAELGSDAELLHAHTGWVAREAGIDKLLAIGPLSRKTVESFGADGYWYESVSELVNHLQTAIGTADVVLVKGSRSMAMEQVVALLTGDDQQVGNA